MKANQSKPWLRALPLIVALAGFYVAVPLHLALGTLSHDQAVAQSDALVTASAKQEIVHAEQVLQHKSQWASSLARMNAAIPTARGFSALVDQLTSLAAATGVSWTSGSLGAPTVNAASTGPTAQPQTAAQPAAISLSMSVSGTSSAVSAFLTGMQSLPRLIVVDTVGMSGAHSGTEKATITATAYLMR